MIILLIFWCGELAVLNNGDQITVIDTVNARVSQVQGQRLSLLQQSIIVKYDAQLLAVDSTGARTTLPDLAAKGLMAMDFPQVQLPVVVNLQKAFVLWDDVWRAYDLPMWIEFQARRPVIGASTELAAIGYQLVQLSPNKLIAYDPKSGTASILQPQGRPIQMSLDKRLTILRWNQYLVWAGRPSESRIGFASLHDPFPLVSSTNVPDFSSHSFMMALNDQLWVATFSEGIRDLLRSWKSERLAVNFYTLAAQLKPISQGSLMLPVSFEVGTSASGSPRLNPVLGFAFREVAGSSHLAVVKDGSLIVLGSGQPQHFEFNRTLGGLRFNGAKGLEAIEPSGSTHLLTEVAP